MDKDLEIEINRTTPGIKPLNEDQKTIMECIERISELCRHTSEGIIHGMLKDVQTDKIKLEAYKDCIICLYQLKDDK